MPILSPKLPFNCFFPFRLVHDRLGPPLAGPLIFCHRPPASSGVHASVTASATSVVVVLIVGTSLLIRLFA